MKIILICAALALSPSSFASQLSFETDRSLPLVFLNIAFKGGATQDPDKKSGATTLMTKLLLRGTKQKTKQQIDQLLDQLGASLDTETRAEYVVLRGSVLAENFAPFLNLVEEIISTPSFRVAELEKLKKEQISEILEQTGQDQSLLRIKFDQIFFNTHPYSKPSAGKVKDLQSLTVENIESQYRKIFDQSRMLILGAGDAKESDLSQFSKNLNEKLNHHSEIQPIPEFKNPVQKTRVVIIDKPERTQTQIAIAQTGINFSNTLLDALQLANFSFGGGTFNSKLMVELRVKRGWTYGAGSNFKLGSQPHTWRVSFFPKNADTPAAIKEALHLIRELRDHGISAESFEAAKRTMVNSAGFDLNTPAKRMENMLVEKIFGLPADYQRNSAKRIQALTLEEVNSALRKFIQPDRLTIVLVGTASISRAPIAKELGLQEKDIEVVDYLF